MMAYIVGDVTQNPAFAGKGGLELSGCGADMEGKLKLPENL